MKLLVKNRLNDPIHVALGDHLQVSHECNGRRRVVADFRIKVADTFNTVFIAALEPGDMGFARGYIGGIVQENPE